MVAHMKARRQLVAGPHEERRTLGMGRRGPLPWQLDAKELILLDRLGVAGCSCRQAAAYFDKDIKTVTAAVRRQLGAELSEFLADKRAKGEAALLLKAHDLASSGNSAMLKLALTARLGWAERQGALSDLATLPTQSPRQSIVIGGTEIVF